MIKTLITFKELTFYGNFIYLFKQSIVNVIGMNKMTPPIKDLLPRLTPILKNR